MSNKQKNTRRTNGEGSVYQMKDGRYGAACSLGKDENGKRVRHVETGKTEQEVIDKCTSGSVKTATWRSRKK